MGFCPRRRVSVSTRIAARCLSAATVSPEVGVAFAAWFGLLATALNLFPIGQLDGGHISYAALGARSTLVTISAAIAVVLLTFQSRSWIAWAVLIIVMLVTFGPRHPRTLDHHLPLDDNRRLVAIAALAIFILCFTPAPIEFIGPALQ